MRKIILSVIFIGLLIGNNASAISFGSMREYYVVEGGLGYPIDDSHTQSIVNFSRAGNDVWASINGTQVSQWTQMHMQLNATIPANSLVSFNVTYKGTSDTAPTPVWFYNGLQLDYDRFLIGQECTSINGARVYASGTFTQMTCNYLAYFPQASSIIDTAYYSHIIEVAGVNTVDSVMTVVVSPVSSIQANFDSLSESDRTWLEEHMPSGSSTADIESAIESAREDEKSEYEEQQENVEGGADDAGEEAEAATSTLIETGRNIIETIRDTPATNCVIRIRTRNFDTGNLNLCNVPQEIRTVISTIITIPVTLAALHIAYSVVMLYLTTVRKEQE